MIIQVKLVGVSLYHISFVTVHELSPHDNTFISTFNRPPFSYFWFLIEVVLLKIAHPLKIYQNIKFRGPTLTGESFASISKV
jgi:hypothetical protein